MHALEFTIASVFQVTMNEELYWVYGMYQVLGPALYMSHLTH